jgi:hypothetical protein
MAYYCDGGTLVKLLTVAAITAASVAMFGVTQAGAAEAAARAYPIHYDGPMVKHGPLVFANTLPKFGVTFHGGPVQLTTKTFNIYWKPAGTFMAPGYEMLMNRFLKDAGGSDIYQVGTTYSGSNGQVQNVSTFGGSWIDLTPYPKNISDADLQTEITKAIAANGWPVGLGSQFFIYTSKHAIPSVGFCAYHSAFLLGGHGTSPVVYGFIPYVGYVNGCNPPYNISPNNNVDADGSIISVSHEQMEMVTDPLLNSWFGVGGEIGDICVISFGVPFASGGANLMAHGDPYIVQEEWEQTALSCQPNL